MASEAETIHRGEWLNGCHKYLNYFDLTIEKER
jgi:hypothetical protein